MIRAKKAACLFLLILVMLPVSGCWNKREVNDMSYITAFGVDRIVADGKPQFNVSMLVVRTAGTAMEADGIGGMPRSQRMGAGDVISAQGETVFDAVRNWNLRSPRQLFLSHSLVLVIGEEMAREGIGELIEFAARHREFRLRSWVVVCRGKAVDALQVRPEFEKLVSVEIARTIERNKPRVSKAEASDLFQVMYDLLTPGKEAVVSHLKLFSPPEKSSPMSGEGNSSGAVSAGAQDDSGGIKTFAVSGSAVFLGDRLAGWLDEEESQGLLFIQNRATGGVIPFAVDAPEKNSSLLYRAAKGKVKLVFEDGEPVFEIRIKAKGELLEEKGALIDVTRQQDIKKAEELINEEVERRCLKAVEKCQELRSDVFGFGDKIHRYCPGYWKQIQNQWTELFPYVKVTVKADFTIEHPGLFSRPFVIE